MIDIENGAAVFEKGMTALHLANVASIPISEDNMQRVHTGRQNRGLFLFAKMICHNMSIEHIVQPFVHGTKGGRLLDHCSVAALARVSMDAAVMTLYITEPTLSIDQWNLRRKVLYLHDLTTRKRFLEPAAKYGQKPPFFENYEEMKQSLRAEIQDLCLKCGFIGQEMEEMKAGNRVFVNGFRGAVREAGLDLDMIDFCQSYLSSFVHSHPVSFMNADKHEISFQEPSDFQLGLCGISAAIAADLTELVNNRMLIFCNKFDQDPLGHVE